MRRRDGLAFAIILGITIIFFLIIFSFFRGIGEVDNLRISRGEKVGIVEVYGEIYDSRPFIKEMERMLSLSVVKAVVVRIESPGGAVAASQEIYTTIKKAREKLPIVVSMGNLAASGGYYAAIAADSIVANPGTTTGSIGVLSGITMFYRLTDKIGLDFETIKSGKYKDTGNPFRQLTPEDRKYLQGLVDDTYEQFIQAISEERHIPLAEVRKIADGRVFTGKQALALGLVDKIGDFQDAVNIAGKMGGIKGKPEILEKKKKRITLYDLLFGDLEETAYKLSRGRMEMKYILP
jgi:protease-4